jgi:cell division protein FtsI/penicillin-binding protein 2
MASESITRLRLFFILALILAMLLLTRLYFLTIVHGDEYREIVARQYQTPAGHSFDRGAIYFTDKFGERIGAATLASGATLAVNPSVLTDVQATYEALAQHVQLDRTTFMTRAGRSSDTYEEVAKRLDRATADAIDALALPGVILVREKWRVYPGARLASHALGFVGWKGNEQTGQYGLESYYNDVLTRNGESAPANFFSELFTDVGKKVIQGSGLPGDIETTIEPSVQAYVEQSLAKIQTTWKPDTVGAIVIDPNNGEIKAIAALPDFDPNTYQHEDNAEVFKNPLVENVYEMGSIVKPLTMAAGIDAGVVTPDSTYDDRGYLDLNSETIYNFDKVGRGRVSMQEVLNQSLNTGVAYVALKMGHESFSTYMHSFGIGEETGIDMPSEARGLVENLSSTRDIEAATASYGQGIAVTPIMIVRALSSLGNGGILINPHVVKKINYDVGYSKSPDFSSTRQVLSKKTSEEITRMLVTVVDKALLKGEVKLPRYSVAAKTGTAQMANPAGGYYSDRYLHSFFGYFPAYDPRFLVFLFAVNPQGANYASQTLTNPFMDITKFILSYYEVPPDR